MKDLHRIGSALSAMLAVAALATPCRAQDERKLGWGDVGELSFVQTSGNTDTSTLGFKNKLEYLWEKSGLAFDAGAVRASSKDLNVGAEGTASSFDTIDGERDTTAEIYYFNTRYNREISEKFFWYVGAGWDRNRGAGIKNRYVGEAGVGNLWSDTPTFRFLTAYAATYTDREDYVVDPEDDDAFAGVRLSYDLMWKLGEPTVFTSKLIFDDNLSDTQDYRADMINSIAVAMSQTLALKVSLQWLYQHQPGLKNVPLSCPPGTPAAECPSEVAVELDELDSILTASVVATF